MYQPPGSQPPPWQGGGTPPPFGPGGGTPPPYYPQQPPPPPRSNGPLMLVLGGIGLVVVLVLAVVAFVVLREDDDKTPAARPTGSDVFTSAYAGKWTSTVYQKKPTTGTFVATVEIAAGSATGTITYTNSPGDSAGTWSCSGTLTFLKRTGGSGYKTVVREHLTTKTTDRCGTFGYDVLFPKDDGTGMFLTTYVTQTAAEVDKDYYAIGTLEKQ